MIIISLQKMSLHPPTSDNGTCFRRFINLKVSSIPSFCPTQATTWLRTTKSKQTIAYVSKLSLTS